MDEVDSDIIAIGTLGTREDPVAIGGYDSERQSPPPVEAPGNGFGIAPQMDVEGVLPEGFLQPTEHPAQAVIHLDMVGRIRQPFISQALDPRLMVHRIIIDM
jgi:hypothetical protein